MPVLYRPTALDSGLLAEIIVENRAIPELKSVERVVRSHEAQLLTHRRLAGCRVGLLINFNTISMTDGVTRVTLHAKCCILKRRMMACCSAAVPASEFAAGRISADPHRLASRPSQ